jgi:hypothetical protein
MPTRCPQCQSKHVSKSKRRGLLESLVFRLIQVRPYRCLTCDWRFFRRAAPHGRSATHLATTSTQSDLQGARSPLTEREGTQLTEL